MVSPITSLGLTLSDLFEGLYLIKEPSYGMLPVNKTIEVILLGTNRISYINGESNGTIKFDLE